LGYSNNRLNAEIKSFGARQVINLYFTDDRKMAAVFRRKREIIEAERNQLMVGHVVFACARLATGEAVVATRNSVFNGRRDEDSTVTSVRADHVDHSTSIVG